jgi:hypothetical protein
VLDSGQISTDVRESDTQMSQLDHETDRLVRRVIGNRKAVARRPRSDRAGNEFPRLCLYYLLCRSP